ncbi:MAG: WbqC family protein [Bacteroidota bacterium]
MLITTTAYFPPLSHYMLAIRQHGWKWEAHENYQKGGWRNRCQIAGPNKVELLSIPLVKGKHQSTPIRDVQISYTNDWVRLHKRSISAAYGRSPYFEHYAPMVFEVLDKRHHSLWELNMELHKKILNIFITSYLFDFTDKYTHQYPETVLDLRRKSAHTDIHHSPYPQVFEDRHGFLSDLSILDLLFCLGPSGSIHLRKSNAS